MFPAKMNVCLIQALLYVTCALAQHNPYRELNTERQKLD
jgi:hypothetical protein